MKRLHIVLAVLFALGLTVPAVAQTSVVCQGTACGGGGGGGRAYEYSVSMPGGFNHFHVGTHDNNIANYSNWLLPQGWSVIGIFGPLHLDDGYTAHGTVSAPTGMCIYSISFGGPQIPTGVIGFDHPWSPHDVGWEVVGAAGTVTETWASPVGTGQGPVHGPVPEPGSLLILGSGLIGLAGTVLRRRG